MAIPAEARMSAAGRKRRTQIAGQFAARTIEMLESPAYRVLTLTAHRVMSRLEIELAHHGGCENGRLPVTYEHFVEYGMDRHAVGPAISELEALGFVEVTEQGRAGNAEWRTPNYFRLTYRHTDRAAPTDDWKRITTEADAQHRARLARSAGRLNTALHRRPKKIPSGGLSRISVGETHTENA
jgi:hypothetical protein